GCGPVTNRTRSLLLRNAMCDTNHNCALTSGERTHNRPPARPKPAPLPVRTVAEASVVRTQGGPGAHPESHTWPSTDDAPRGGLRALCTPSTLTGGLTELAWVGAHMLMY